jgi:hypothetical protein
MFELGIEAKFWGEAEAEAEEQPIQIVAESVTAEIEAWDWL